MGSMSVWHWLVLIAVVALLFGGRGKVSDLMGDFAKGIKAFKKGMADEDTPVAATTTTPPVSAERRALDGQPLPMRADESKVL